MSASATDFVRSWRVGRFVATLSMPRPQPGAVISAVVEWSPRFPEHLNSAELKQYQSGRNAALADLAAEFSFNIAVMDL